MFDGGTQRAGIRIGRAEHDMICVVLHRQQRDTRNRQLRLSCGGCCTRQLQQEDRDFGCLGNESAAVTGMCAAVVCTEHHRAAHISIERRAA